MNIIHCWNSSVCLLGFRSHMTFYIKGDYYYISNYLPFYVVTTDYFLQML